MTTTSPDGTPILYTPQGGHAIYLAPADGAPTARVLLVTPLFEEKRCAHRALITCGRTLARAGAAVLIPDLSGTGNSARQLADLSLADWVADVQAAAEWLATQAPGPLTVVGCRAGALLATAALAEGVTAARCILWQPVSAGRSYLSQARTRRAIQHQVTGGDPPVVGPHEVEGETLSEALHTALGDLKLPATAPAGEVRLLQCSFNEKLLGEYARLAEGWQIAPERIRCIVTEPFWYPHNPGPYTELAEALCAEVMA